MDLKKGIYLITLIIILTGCGSSKQTAKGKYSESEEIVRFAMKYLNTPYCRGGYTSKCFDCSGYVQFVYDKFGYLLPRSSSEQIHIGKKINTKDLRPGDLVFFRGSNAKSKKTGHVGIVTQTLKDNEFLFIHAAVNGGIRIDKSNTPYYKSRYIQAKRIID